MTLLVVAAAFAALPPCPVPAVPGAPVQVGLQTHGHQVAGLGIAELTDTRWGLTLLAPAGFELFTVSGPPTAVATGLEAWKPWLERLPVERDLRLVFTPATESCTSGGGRIHVTRGSRRWCGPGGGATVTEADGNIILVDRRRGYTLTLRATGAPG